MEAATIPSTNALDLVLSQLDAAGCDPKPKGARRWLSRCPAHEDSTPSLRVSQGDRVDVVVTCFAGCTFTDVIEALGLRCDASRSDGSACSSIVGVNRRQCDYHDPDRDRSSVRLSARPLSRRVLTDVDTVEGPAWDAWARLGMAYGDAPRVLTEKRDVRQMVDQARAWITYLAREAQRVGDQEMIDRLLRELGGDQTEDPAVAVAMIEAFARDLATSGNGPGLARALRSAQYRQHDASKDSE